MLQIENVSRAGIQGRDRANTAQNVLQQLVRQVSIAEKRANSFLDQPLEPGAGLGVDNAGELQSQMPFSRHQGERKAEEDPNAPSGQVYPKNSYKQRRAIRQQWQIRQSPRVGGDEDAQLQGY